MLSKFWLLIIAGIISSGCARQLYHYHRTVVGVDISGNVSGQTPSGHLTIGYSRGLVVVVPDELTRPQEASASRGDPAKGDRQESGLLAGKGQDAPSTVFCTQVKASLGGVSTFREILATGEAAEKYAEFLASAEPLALDARVRNFVCPDITIPSPAARPGQSDSGAKGPK